METKEPIDSTNEEPTLDHEESVGDNMLATLKPFLFAILGLSVLMGIFVLLPMLLTYISEGNVRP